MSTAKELLEKYGETIQEEVNVKSVTLLSDDISVQKQYVPIGKELSSAFGKDTGAIIGAAKQGNIKEIPSGIIVFQGEQERTLEPYQYEIRYQGFDKDNQTVEDGAMVELDTQLTEELKEEGVAREISRFLNQMRKDADYQVDARVVCWYQTEDEQSIKILTAYQDYLQNEALLTTIQATKDITGSDLIAEFESEETGNITFGLKQ